MSDENGKIIVYARIPSEMNAALVQEANDRGVSRSAVIRWAIEDYYDRKVEDWRKTQEPAAAS